MMSDCIICRLELPLGKWELYGVNLICPNCGSLEFDTLNAEYKGALAGFHLFGVSDFVCPCNIRSLAFPCGEGVPVALFEKKETEK
jgi:hypothetical protein